MGVAVTTSPTHPDLHRFAGGCSSGTPFLLCGFTNEPHAPVLSLSRFLASSPFLRRARVCVFACRPAFKHTHAHTPGIYIYIYIYVEYKCIRASIIDAAFQLFGALACLVFSFAAVRCTHCVRVCVVCVRGCTTRRMVFHASPHVSVVFPLLCCCCFLRHQECLSASCAAIHSLPLPCNPRRLLASMCVCVCPCSAPAFPRPLL